MDKKERFMEAVAAKVGGKRRPMMKRKGGPAVLIAIGAPKPKPEMGEDEMGDEKPEMKGSKAEKIAMLQEKIASLKAELALLEDEDEAEDEAEDEEYEDEEED
ncbi:MAG: hypothetical protein ACO3GP_06470 [Candidatus Limnocylindrus sp.]